MIKSFSEEKKEVVFEDRGGTEHKLAFEELDELITFLHKIGYIKIETVAKLVITRQWKIKEKSDTDYYSTLTFLGTEGRSGTAAREEKNK